MRHQNEVIRIFIAEDHAIVRKTVAAFLHAESDIEVVGEAESTESLLEKVDRSDPDVLLLDANMPGPGSSQITALLQTHCPDVRVLVLSAFNRQQQVVDLMNAGADGYLLKEENPRDLLRAIRAVASGEEWFSPKITGVLVQSMRDDALKEELHLTPREKDVLRLMVTGADNREIADKLYIATNTVKNHVRHIFSKLEVSTRVEAVLFALDHNLVDDE